MICLSDLHDRDIGLCPIATSMATQSSSAARTPSDVDISEAPDVLTTLPSELLIKIICKIPSKYFLDLVQTSRFLRNFVKLNASKICNEVIRTLFLLEDTLLRSELEAGWLVPTHDIVTKAEQRIQKLEFGLYFYDFHRNKRSSKTFETMYLGLVRQNQKRSQMELFSLLGELHQDSKIHLAVCSPGPQYLYFLETDPLVIGIGDFQTFHFQRVAQAEVDGQRFFFDIWDESGSIRRLPYSLWDFLKRFNLVELNVKDQQELMKPEGSEQKFPRELIWFYGVERLRYVKDEERKSGWNWRR